jgi:hypothetical protein
MQQIRKPKSKIPNQNSKIKHGAANQKTQIQNPKIKHGAANNQLKKRQS